MIAQPQPGCWYWALVGPGGRIERVRALHRSATWATTWFCSSAGGLTDWFGVAELFATRQQAERFAAMEALAYEAGSV